MGIILFFCGGKFQNLINGGGGGEVLIRAGWVWVGVRGPKSKRTSEHTALLLLLVRTHKRVGVDEGRWLSVRSILKVLFLITTSLRTY